MLTEEQIIDALRGVMDPELRRSLVELGMVKNVEIEDGQVRFTLALTTLACPLKEQIVSEARAAVLALEGIETVDVKLAEMTVEEKKRIGIGNPDEGGIAEHFNDIKRVIAVMSGKGGVGKSLVSSLLAVALRRQGERVGVLDADITGPSIPKMFFPNSVRPGQSPLGILPAETETGIKVMSINLLLPNEDDAVIWRGPLISGAIRQFWGDVFWGDLDWLIVDLPPGTSDASLTVMQSLPMSGVVLVSSPQDLAGMVVRKAASMAQRLGVPILGLVENMSYFVCPDTGKRYELFGPSHAEEMARKLWIPFLGRLPIDPEIARLCDAGQIEEYAAEEFAPMAEQLMKAARPARQPMFPVGPGKK
ncbi:MAG: Mrp/NBP35 family ATP-binding protein [Chloroflexi bacterium]|nr:Mrp/NBP35 family ATP-binding protein [Chloroflexota bacterium]